MTIRNRTVDIFRVFAVLGVILIHTAPFKSWNSSSAQITAALISQVIRFAVPYFFIMAGYFWTRKLQVGHPLGALMKTYALRIGGLFVIWTLIYLAEPAGQLRSLVTYGTPYLPKGRPLFLMQHPLTLLFEGSRVHLWFLMSLLQGLAITALLIRFQKTRLLIVLAAVLYVLGLLSGPYLRTPIGIDLHFNTRNGPFMSLLFVTVGWAMAKGHFKFCPRAAAALTAFGFAVSVLEAGILASHFGVPPYQNYLAGTVIYSIGIAAWAAADPVGRRDWRWVRVLAWAGRYTLGIYLAHLIFLDLFRSIEADIHHAAWEIVMPIAVYLLSLGLVAMLAQFRITRRLVQ